MRLVLVWVVVVVLLLLLLFISYLTIFLFNSNVTLVSANSCDVAMMCPGSKTT